MYSRQRTIVSGLVKASLTLALCTSLKARAEGVRGHSAEQDIPIAEVKIAELTETKNLGQSVPSYGLPRNVAEQVISDLQGFSSIPFAVSVPGDCQLRDQIDRGATCFRVSVRDLVPSEPFTYLKRLTVLRTL